MLTPIHLTILQHLTFLHTKGNLLKWLCISVRLRCGFNYQKASKTASHTWNSSHKQHLPKIAKTAEHQWVTSLVGICQSCIHSDVLLLMLIMCGIVVPRLSTQFIVFVYQNSATCWRDLLGGNGYGFYTILRDENLFKFDKIWGWRCSVETDYL